MMQDLPAGAPLRRQLGVASQVHEESLNDLIKKEMSGSLVLEVPLIFCLGTWIAL
jgi:hypothetical protein